LRSETFSNNLQELGGARMSRSTTANRRDELSGELLELFYPVHYQVGMALEDALRDRRLTRKQVAILWLIRSIGGERRGLSRKQIQQAVTNWFEVSNSQITKALRAMARPPLGLIQIAEDPSSGREKQVLLTAKGERFLLTLVERGRAFFRPVGERLAPELIRDGLVFLRQASAALGDAKPAGGFNARRK
jgi:DNA-binding MarR family transcriptional regulator